MLTVCGGFVVHPHRIMYTHAYVVFCIISACIVSVMFLLTWKYLCGSVLLCRGNIGEFHCWCSDRRSLEINMSCRSGFQHSTGTIVIVVEVVRR